jgi:branched-chain amino acid transport system permease protein
MSGAIVAVLASTLVLGSLYALLTAGLALIWSTVRVFNYAHGALLIASGYLTWTFSERLGMPVPLALIVAMPIMAAVGIGIEVIAVRPFTRRPEGTLLVMVSTLALATAVEGAIQLVWGPQDKQLPSITTATFTVAGVAVRWTTLISASMALTLVGGLIVAVNRTQWGASIRAVAQNREMSALLGIRAGIVHASVFAAAAVLACAAAFVFAASTTLTPGKGSAPLLTAFVVLVFGGTATLWGTLAGGYAIGFLEAATGYWLGLQWSPIAVFVVLVVVMLVRPEGLVRGAR